MPTRIRHDQRTEDVLNAVIHLIDTEGIGAVSIRNIADLVRRRPSTLTSHLTNKARILRLSGLLLADRIEREVSSRCSRVGPVGLLPDPETLPERRAWLGLVELARSQPDLAAVVAQARADRADLLRQVVGEPGAQLPDSTVDAVLATVDGLTARMCADVEPMPADRAEAALAAVLGALGCCGGSSDAHDVGEPG